VTMYSKDRSDFKGDKLTALKAEYEKLGSARSNMRYGYVVPNEPVDYSLFA
jgi:hypothetical protein